MSIEVRNIFPIDDKVNVSLTSNIEFDLVGLDSYSIDIDSLSIEITTD